VARVIIPTMDYWNIGGKNIQKMMLKPLFVKFVASQLLQRVYFKHIKSSSILLKNTKSVLTVNLKLILIRKLKFILIQNTLNTMNRNYHVGLVKRNSSTITPLNNTFLINVFIQSIGKMRSRKEYSKFLAVIVKKFSTIHMKLKIIIRQSILIYPYFLDAV